MTGWGRVPRLGRQDSPGSARRLGRRSNCEAFTCWTRPIRCHRRPKLRRNASARLSSPDAKLSGRRSYSPHGEKSGSPCVICSRRHMRFAHGASLLPMSEPSAPRQTDKRRLCRIGAASLWRLRCRVTNQVRHLSRVACCVLCPAGSVSLEGSL